MMENRNSVLTNAIQDGELVARKVKTLQLHTRTAPVSPDTHSAKKPPPQIVELFKVFSAGLEHGELADIAAGRQLRDFGECQGRHLTVFATSGETPQTQSGLGPVVVSWLCQLAVVLSGGTPPGVLLHVGVPIEAIREGSRRILRSAHSWCGAGNNKKKPNSLAKKKWFRWGSNPRPSRY
jgi:hypothetical protein